MITINNKTVPIYIYMHDYNDLETKSCATFMLRRKTSIQIAATTELKPLTTQNDSEIFAKMTP